MYNEQPSDVTGSALSSAIVTARNRTCGSYPMAVSKSKEKRIYRYPSLLTPAWEAMRHGRALQYNNVLGHMSNTSIDTTYSDRLAATTTSALPPLSLTHSVCSSHNTVDVCANMYLDLANPNACNSTGTVLHAVDGLGSFRSQAYPSPLSDYGTSTPSLRCHTPTGILRTSLTLGSESPFGYTSPDILNDILLFQLPTTSATPQPIAKVTSNRNLAQPGGHEIVSTTRSPGVSPGQPNSDSPGLSAMFDTIPMFDITPLPLVHPLFLTPEQVTLKLLGLKRGRSRARWENWEHQIILDKLLGRSADPLLIKKLLSTPEKLRGTLEELEIPRVWHDLSSVSFRGARSVKAIVAQWWALADTFVGILTFAKRAGVDLNSAECEHVPALISQIIVSWRREVPDGQEWEFIPKLTISIADLAAWTYDPINGWFAMMSRRLKEADIILPLGGKLERPSPKPPLQPSTSAMQSNRTPRRTPQASPRLSPLTRPTYWPRGNKTQGSRGSSHDPSTSAPRRRTTASSPATISASPPRQVDPTCETLFIQEDLPAENDTPITLEDDSLWGVLHKERAVASASIDLARANAECARARALKIRAEVLTQLLSLEQNERTMRLHHAIDIIGVAEATTATRDNIEAWVTQNFFSSHPTEDFSPVMRAWATELDIIRNRDQDSYHSSTAPATPQLL
ncbi:hypothetical protein CTheo_7542 [Ceratobasidium theobromae]|uniref:Uncharacterized protein n=1 Tax=Ceratobasidium theobromae TaxID=1582974 RepID=A0A5N5QCE0_9AGAM|nr:hypothetical protein CTheo_7542 [Ceratobasidium theobromae]